MALAFSIVDKLHELIVKFVPAFFPSAKKKYNARVSLQTALDIPALASKAAVYNIQTSSEVIAEGLTAGCKLIYYLVADGFDIRLPICRVRAGLPGEYEGTETHLPEGVRPRALFSPNGDFQRYLEEHAAVRFDGVLVTDGMMGEMEDQATGDVDSAATIGRLFIARRLGLRVIGDAEHEADVNAFFVDEAGGETPVADIAINEPKLLKVVAPASLVDGKKYYFKVVTQTSAANSGTLLNNTRSVKSALAVTARNEVAMSVARNTRKRAAGSGDALHAASDE
jgi:hypothetical protein